MTSYSADSSLSSVQSDDFSSPLAPRSPAITPTKPTTDASDKPPKKRRKTNVRGDHAAAASSPPAQPISSSPPPDVEDDISSDSSGEVPIPLNGINYEDEDSSKVQQSYCRWEGCDAGELGNMDNLVKHIHDVHIGSGKKLYSCEWDDCTRKGVTHPSAYALRAHMRSHTREKPFYCELPECDKAFTRSDALAKHMRTVHETEANKQAEAAARAAEKLSSASNGPMSLKIKLVLNGKSGRPFSNGPASGDGPASECESASKLNYSDDETEDEVEQAVEPRFPLPRDLFTDEEVEMGTEELLAVLEREAQWAEEEKQRLSDQETRLRRKRLKEWRMKELLLDDLIELSKGEPPQEA